MSVSREDKGRFLVISIKSVYKRIELLQKVVLGCAPKNTGVRRTVFFIGNSTQ